MRRTEELDELDSAIDAAVERRNRYVIAHMGELAEFAIGEKIYARVAANSYKLQRAGVVTEHFIAWSGDRKRARVECRFERDPSYPYGSETGSEWASFHHEAEWQRNIQDEVERLKALV